MRVGVGLLGDDAGRRNRVGTRDIEHPMTRCHPFNRRAGYNFGLRTADTGGNVQLRSVCEVRHMWCRIRYHLLRRWTADLVLLGVLGILWILRIFMIHSWFRISIVDQEAYRGLLRLRLHLALWDLLRVHFTVRMVLEVLL